MPEGQFTGARGLYLYEDDTGEFILLTLDTTLVLANSGLVLYDPENPPAGGACPAGNGFKPRVVFWQGTAAGFENARKSLVAGTNVAGLYATNLPQAITIDEVAGLTTGRKGESRSF